MRLLRESKKLHVRAGLALILTVGLPAVALSQQGTVTGRVTAVGSGEPLVEGRVMVAGTSVAATTNSDGRYTLRGVPSTPVEIRVIRVGYQEQKKPVTVAPGGTATVDFTLTPAVVKLQEIVTTATGEQRKVEIGNAITAIGDISTKVEQNAVHSMSDLLVAKAPGVFVLPGNMTGSAPVIRIRGLNSLSLNNEPIYVIDGVRMNSGVIGGGVGGTNTSYLNNLDPEEIEDIEIVKGPSAATLYGTDAANGVVVITTRKGKAGATRWTYNAEQGVVDDRNKYPDTYAIFGHAPGKTALARCVLVTIASGACIADSTTSYNLLADPQVSPIHLGKRGQFGGNATGGSDQVRFFVSGDVENETGPLQMPGFGQAFFDSVGTTVRDEWLHPEALQRKSFRTNLSSAMTPKLDLSVNAGFSQTDQRLAQVDNNTFSFIYNALQNPGFKINTPSCSVSRANCLGLSNIGGLGEDLHGYGFYTPAQLFQVVREQGIQRFIGSANAQWRPLAWMQNEGTIGTDLADRDNFSLCRFNECPASGTTRLGSVGDTKSNDRNFSAKLVSNMSYQYRPWMNLKTSLGTDYVNQENDFAQANGRQLPPGAQNVGQAAVQTANSQLQRVNKTLGVYAQEQASIRDRLFLTAAVRTDQNSAFGTKFQRVFYPKASLSWILSDESFFPKFDVLNSFRLRSAYGASGVQPGSTTALQTFAASTVNLASTPGNATGTDTPGLLASELGNPDLKPERSAEFENGFEARLFNSRLNVDFTYYARKTRDALISQPIAASAGASSLSVFQNIGSVENSGEELAINTTLLDRRNFGWDMTISMSHNSNKIASLGFDAKGNPRPTIGTGATRDSVGLPINAFFYRPYTYADANGDGIIAPSEVTVDPAFAYRGYSSPRDIVSIQNGFDLLQRKVRLNFLLDYKGGFSLFNNTTQFYCQQTNQCYDETHTAASLADQARLVAARYASPTTSGGYLENGQFWRLREVSATITLPKGLASGIRARDASLSLQARNLHVWTKYKGTDPEANYSTGDVQTDFSTTAPPTYFIARLNLHY
jgi:TonB-linked SusC/RagA family outer membrane protein